MTGQGFASTHDLSSRHGIVVPFAASIRFGNRRRGHMCGQREVRRQSAPPKGDTVRLFLGCNAFGKWGTSNMRIPSGAKSANGSQRLGRHSRLAILEYCNQARQRPTEAIEAPHHQRIRRPECDPAGRVITLRTRSRFSPRPIAPNFRPFGDALSNRRRAAVVSTPWSGQSTFRH